MLVPEVHALLQFAHRSFGTAPPGSTLATEGLEKRSTTSPPRRRQRIANPHREQARGKCQELRLSGVCILDLTYIRSAVEVRSRTESACWAWPSPLLTAKLSARQVLEHASFRGGPIVRQHRSSPE